jgi:nitroimidazol reductase NimA-like FMN-containing flavoprotein (pyridoxamine 5'-phosphate oxidase superfamily)
MRPNPAAPRGARHEVRRLRERAAYDRASVHAVLDAGFLAHVAFAVDGQPFVIPMLYAREGDAVLLHGSIASRLMRTLADGVPAALSVAHVDGLVLARSHFHHSVNYRSAVCFGTARAVDDADAKSAALARFVDAIVPGRAAESRSGDRNELAATALVRFEIDDASAKARSGGPKDDPADRDLPVWAGVVPTHVAYGIPEPDENGAAFAPPESVRRLIQGAAQP